MWLITCLFFHTENVSTCYFSNHDSFSHFVFWTSKNVSFIDKKILPNHYITRNYKNHCIMFYWYYKFYLRLPYAITQAKPERCFTSEIHVIHRATSCASFYLLCCMNSCSTTCAFFLEIFYQFVDWVKLSFLIIVCSLKEFLQMY